MADKTKVITLEELKLHKDEKSLWIAIYDNVYDITKFAAEVNVLPSSDALSHVFKWSIGAQSPAVCVVGRF